MDAKLIERINELARLAKERPLTPEETQERARLRAEYLTQFRENTRRTLESAVFERPDGTTFQLNRKPRDKGSLN
jgi:uncharacterized protein YnzC (UPF0291/DUF896 family)